MKTIRLFLFFLAIASGVAAQNTDSLSYHNSHQLSDTSYSVVKANGDSTIFLFEGGNSSGSNYRTMSVNADSTQVIWQGGSQPADTLEVWGLGVTTDSNNTSGSGNGNYHLPYNGDSTDYLGGDTAYHALPNSWNLNGNSNANAASFIGPTGNYPLRFKSFSGTNSGFTGGGYSTAFGYDTYSYDTSVLYSFSMNTAFGATALHSLQRSTSTSNFGNVAIGFAALSNAKAGTGNIAIGSYALLGSGVSNDKIFKSNIGIGSVSLASLTNGIGNIAIGDSSFKNLSSGNYNIGLGTKVVWNQTTLSPYLNNFFYVSDSTYHLHMKLDSAVGSAPSVIGKDGNGNWHVYQTPSTSGGTTYTLPIASASTLGGIKIGTGLSIDGNGIVNVSTTGWNTTGNTALSTDFLGPINDVNLTFKRNNQVVGLITGYSGGTQNVYWGDLVNTSGVSNVRIGSGAGTTVSNSGYSQNVIIGFTAGGMGSYNTGVGSNSLAGLNAVAFTTNYNVGLGYNSGTSLSNGTYNTMLGVNAGVTTINSLYTNSTALGANSTITKSNQIVLGDPNITQVLTYGNVLSKVKQQASDPTTTDIPDGFTAVYRNTTSGFTYLWANIGGTLLKVQLN